MAAALHLLNASCAGSFTSILNSFSNLVVTRHRPLRMHLLLSALPEPHDSSQLMCP